MRLAGATQTLRMIPLLLIVAAHCPSACGKAIYVDDDAKGANDGTSWDDAYVHLQDALADANSAAEPAEIRVGQGIYRPDQGASQSPGREATFQLINGVTIKGGYAGFASPDPWHRRLADPPDPNDHDVAAYKAVLSGEIGAQTLNDNCYHVLTGSGCDETAILDGLTISGGVANGAAPHDCGGGMYNDDGSPTIVNCTLHANYAWFGAGLFNGGNSRSVLNNCTFSQNVARDKGGGMYNSQSTPTLTNCEFLENGASTIPIDAPPSPSWTSGEGSGAGMYNEDSSPLMTSCTFTANEADRGAGMYNAASSPMLTDCTLSENVSGFGGGGMANHENSAPILQDCVFVANHAHVGGGGMDNFDSAPTLIECTFRENSVNFFGGGMSNDHSSPVIRNCRFVGNSAGLGGAIQNGNSPDTLLTNCMFLANSAYVGGGAISSSSGSRPMPSGPVITNCRFVGNSGGNRGGAIQNGDSSDALLTNCIFLANSAREGAAITSSNSRPTLIGCTISGNRAVYPGATVCCLDNSSPRLANCILWANDAGYGPDVYVENGSSMWVAYSGIQGGWPGEGNLDLDPCFVEPGFWDPNGTPDDPNNDFWVEGDYHLKSEAGRWDPNSESWVLDDVTSPCIDRGDPNSPVGDEPDPNGGIINMGAYGGTGEASMSTGPLQPLPLPPPVAYWRLDEMEGSIAHDSVGGNDAIVHGDGIWQPQGGVVDGALQFDGIDDCIETPLRLNPSEGLFSVFAWVKGGAPGQAILSQHYGATWLLVTDDGALATELSGPGANDVLISAASITDGNWHRVGLTWDGWVKTLYVDDVNVAEYAQTSLVDQDTILFIGACGPTRGPARFRAGTFFSGLIDDVRIYNWAVKP